MQTFLPYKDFAASAKVLDMRRLGKQRVETLTILATLLKQSSIGHDWSNHPAVVMWRGYEGALFRYGMTICQEWESRGYQDGTQGRLVELMSAAINLGKVQDRMALQPYWLGVAGFHLSHQSNLVRKEPEIYRKEWPDVPDDLAYVWPRFREDLQGPWTPRESLVGSARASSATLESSEGPLE